MDLFGDLPEPTNTGCKNKAAVVEEETGQTGETEERGEKRKREADLDEQQVEEKDEAEKNDWLSWRVL